MNFHELKNEEEALEIIAATKSKDKARKIDCCQQSVGKYVWLS